MKILYLTTVGATMGFFEPFIRELLEEGHTIDIACNDEILPVPECYREWGCKIYGLPCTRSPYDVGNIKAVQKIKTIVEKGKYDIVHCHTPIVSVCTRIACRRVRKNGTKVFYTAHGFHFYKGAPIWNWLFYYPIEWLCSWWTDILITINKEDDALAKNNFHAIKTVYVPGVGIDVKKYRDITVDRNKKCEELGIKPDDIIVFSVGELNKNKNHKVIIEALSEINNPEIYYVIAGKGNLGGYLQELARRLNVNLHLLGYRSDIPELLKCADLYILPSIREGLNVSLMEAISSGCKCIASDIRGNQDLLEKEYLFDPLDVNDVKSKIIFACGEQMHECNYSDRFSEEVVIKKMKKLYQEKNGK